ncbi:hypothetical protein BH09PAT4_BH09PAT4_01120 [soil metagenome]
MINYDASETTTPVAMNTPEVTAEQVVIMRQQALGILSLVKGDEATINEWIPLSRTRGQIGLSSAVLCKGNTRSRDAIFGRFAVNDFGDDGVLAHLTMVYPGESWDDAITDNVLLRNGLASLGARSSRRVLRRHVDWALFDAVRAKHVLEMDSSDSSSLLTADYAGFWGQILAQMNEEELLPQLQQVSEGPRHQTLGVLLGRLLHLPKAGV